MENLLFGEGYKPEAKFTIEYLQSVLQERLQLTIETDALEFARFLVERGQKNIRPDGTPDLQRSILACHIVTQLMSSLHQSGLVYASDSRVEKMTLIVKSKIAEQQTAAAGLEVLQRELE